MMKKTLLVLALLLGCQLASIARNTYVDCYSYATPEVASQPRDKNALPRKKSKAMQAALQNYLTAVDSSGMDIHSIMVVQHGRVLAENWRSQGAADKTHVMWSVSKTFTSIAVGFCISEGLLHLDDRLVSFFPDKLPENPSDNLQAATIHHLLTMNCGQDMDPTRDITGKEGADWVREFLARPFKCVPGTFFCYNSLGTYMLSAIVQKVTGKTVFEYLQPRLFQPLGIQNIQWEESPQGISCGGWGLHLKTEDMARVGVTLLQGGKWRGKQIIPADWVALMTSKKVETWPGGKKPDNDGYLRNDWLVGYCYQMWQCTHGAVRADGARGQFIILLPEQDAVVINTADTDDMRAELKLVWDYILPALEAGKKK